MPLYLAVHRVEAETAKVPLSMIILMDFVKRKSLPDELKCRVVLPCGDVSVSVWDALSQEQLQDWLQLNLAVAEPGLSSTCHEVQEDFSYGLTTVLAQARAAEKVSDTVVAGSRTALDTISRGAMTASDSFRKQVEAFDTKTNLLTATGEAITTLRSRTSQAMESDRVTTAMTSLQAGLSNASSWFSSFTTPKPPSAAPNTSAQGSSGDGQQASRTSLPADPMRQHQPPFSLHQSTQLPVVSEADEEWDQSPERTKQQRPALAAVQGHAAEGGSAKGQGLDLARQPAQPSSTPTGQAVEAAADPATPSTAQEGDARSMFVLSDDVLEASTNSAAASPLQLPASQHASSPLA